jgi:ankyrin repeat protein
MNDFSAAKEMRSAIKQGDIKKVIELVISSNTLLNMMTPFGTWLHVAATKGKLDIVKYLIKCGLNPNVRGGTYNSGALNYAASEGHYNVAQFLLSCGAELDTSEPERNPLFGAIMCGSKEIVQLLLDSGIDASVRYSGQYMKNMDAYDFAIERGQIEIAELLKPYRK